MASSMRAATRYNNSLNSSTKSDPSSSAEFSSTSRAIAKKKDAAPVTTTVNFSSMVKKLVETKRTAKREPTKFFVAADFVAEDLKKMTTAKKGSSGLSGLHKRLFKGGSSGAKGGEESTRNALTEVKTNTRTLAMVLRSERELLSLNQEQGDQIAELQVLLEEKNREVEKLKDLCLKQREEIKSLKSAILFPDVMNSQLQGLLEKQGSELKQAKQLIPSLQKQVTSLTGQLQCLADDLAEVKADKYSGKGLFDNRYSSLRTPSYDQEDAANSLFDQELSSGGYSTPESPDDVFLKDLNPCLTPFSKAKSKEFEVYYSPDEPRVSKSNMQPSHEIEFNTFSSKLSKSSDCCQSSQAGKGLVRTARGSDGSKFTYGKKMHHKLF